MSQTCVCCQKAPGTEKAWPGDMWCRPCLDQAHAENDAMCRTLTQNERDS